MGQREGNKRGDLKAELDFGAAILPSKEHCPCMGRLCDSAVLRCHTWMIVRWICCKFSEEIARSQSHCNEPSFPSVKNSGTFGFRIRVQP